MLGFAHPTLAEGAAFSAAKEAGKVLGVRLIVLKQGAHLALETPLGEEWFGHMAAGKS